MRDLERVLGTSTAMFVIVDFFSTSRALGLKAAGLVRLEAAAASYLLVFRWRPKNFFISRSVTNFLKSKVQELA